MLKRFGRKRLADVLVPAIRYATEGFTVGEVVSVYWRDSEKVLQEDALTAGVYLVATSQRPGGTMTMADLGEFHSEGVEPIAMTYHGWTVHELPPNGQGIAAVEILTIMELFPLSSYGHTFVRTLHAMIDLL